MELKQQLLQLLKRAHETEQAFVAGLAGDERSASGTFEQWSAKDVMAHVAAWKERRAQATSASSRGQPAPPDDDLEKINAGVFEANRNRSWAEVLAYSDRAHSSLVECVRALPHEGLTASQTPPWQEGRPLYRVITYYGYLHPIGHITQYCAERGKIDYIVRLWEEATTLVAQVSDYPTWLGTVQYNLACYCGLSGHQEGAVNTLREALQLNPRLAEWSKEDPDLSSIRDHPDYRFLHSD